jgi:hypothetical protein
MHQMHILTTFKSLQSSTQAEKVGNLKKKKKCENCIRAEKTKYCAMKLSQIRRRIEPCMREIILRFEMNLYKFTFFLIDLFIFVFLSKYRSTYLLGCRNPQGLTIHQQRPRPRG